MDIEGEESKSTKSDDRQALPPQSRKSARFQDENASENNAKKLSLAKMHNSFKNNDFSHLSVAFGFNKRGLRHI